MICFSARVGVLLLILAAGFRSSYAQVHFTDCASRTGNEASLLIPATAIGTLNGQAIAVGAEVAVFTQDGVCAGMSIWRGESLPITLWADDPFTSGKRGFAPGDLLSFRVWIPEKGREYAGNEVSVSYSDTRSYYRTDGKFAVDAIYLVTALSITAEATREGTAAPPGEKRDGTGALMPIGGETPRAFNLAQNYPNPFNPSTTISYELTDGVHVELTVLNMLGQRVRSLVSQYQPAGHYEITFSGANLPSGMYLYRIEAGGETLVRTMLLMK